jgi:hypothetical protein
MPMPAEPLVTAPRAPRRARYVISRDTPRRGELLAAIGVLLIVLHLIFAQLTLILALIFYGVTKVTRWRPAWLGAPAAGGFLWTLAIGPATALAGFTAGPKLVASYVGGIGGDSSRLLHLGVAYSAMGHWLPRQLPVALMAGAAEAAIGAWLDWLHTDEWDVPPPRAGLLVAVRRAAVIRAVRAGGVVARDGACLGVDERSGRPAALAWPEIAGGALVVGGARSGTTTSSFQVVHAAIRLRKPVVVVNLGSANGEGTGLAASLAALCAAVDAPFYEFGASGPGSYEPFRVGSPARRADLVTAMINWSGTADGYRRSFATYLTDVFELIEAAPADRRIPILDDVAHLLDPLALEARLAQVPPYHPRHAALSERVRSSVGLVRAEPELLMTVASQLAQLRESPIGRWLRPAPASGGHSGGGHIDIGRVVRERAVVLFSLGSAGHASAAARLAWLIGQDILATDADLQEIGVDGDGLVWFDHCEGLPQPMLRDLISRGAEAGLPVMLTTSSARAGGGVADQVRALVIHRMPDAESAERFARQTGERLLPEPWAGTGDQELTATPMVTAEALQQLGRGRFALVVRAPAGRLVAAGRTVPAALPAPAKPPSRPAPGTPGTSLTRPAPAVPEAT